MFFDALTMACVAGDLRATILGGRVQQVLLPDRLSVGLEIYARRERHYLLASAHAELGRLLLASEKLRRGVDRETGLLLLLRKYARGAIVSAIEQPPFERILRLEFDHSEWGCSELVVEVMGRHSNIMLVGSGDVVLDVVKRVGPQMSPTRPILPGQPYRPPPPQPKLPPPDLTEYRLRQILAASEPDTQVWKVLVRGVRGMSPLLAREIAFRALGQPRASIAQVERLTPLLDAIGELLAPLDNGRWLPTVVLEGDQPVVYAPYPITHRGDPEPVPSISQAIEAYTMAVASADPYATAKRPVQEAIVKARTRLERRRDALERSMERASKADRWRQWGEWILAYAHTVTPGQKELVAETGSGKPLHIPLDPVKSPAANAEEAKLALRDLEQLETDLELATNRPEIDQVRVALAGAGYLRVKKGKLPKAARSKPLSLVSPDGFSILVGRNSRQNDEVTFRRAKGDDWWFHARGVSGAQRAASRDDPPRRRAGRLLLSLARRARRGCSLHPATPRATHPRRCARSGHLFSRGDYSRQSLWRRFRPLFYKPSARGAGSPEANSNIARENRPLQIRR
jgi:predicted ribosome quality control (RQC) complex YloA/Tae2 family protein